MDHQRKAVNQLSNGKILWGGVGTGKSLTAIAYYAERDNCGDLYVITTAKKRDSLDWEGEAAKFGIGTDRDATIHGVLKVDSWNNIKKYEDVEGHTFIFDEQRLVGSGAWVKSFYKIAKKNSWILLSATPGDTWLDYIPVFVANGFYKNKTEFIRDHVIFSRYSRYPRVDRFVGVSKLERLKREILVEMPFLKHTIRIPHQIDVEYDKELYKVVTKDRWNPYTDRPILNAAELFYSQRRVTNSHPSRLEKIKELLEERRKLIVFYNFNYELEILRTLNNTWSDLYEVAEYNGQVKQPVPDGDDWVYLVQYQSASEAWNCTKTDSMAFYSLTYSYRMYQQAHGRIDRMNTLYKFLSYFSLVSESSIDQGILKALKSKKNFNENRFAATENLKF
jgi:hypothetical protein